MGALAVEADGAHNPKVAGSNPAPAIKDKKGHRPRIYASIFPYPVPLGSNPPLLKNFILEMIIIHFFIFNPI